MSDLNENKPASFDPSPNTEFLREKIKAKPINKKKLLRRTLFTVFAAALFGVVACLTFLFLEPVISERINNGTEEEQTPAQTVSFTDMGEDDIEEILPEDMYANDTEMIEEVLQGNVSEVNQNIQDIEKMLESLEYGIDDYQKLYIQLRTLSESVSYSLVNVVGVSAETDLLDNYYEHSAQVSGVIVADVGPAFMILAKDVGLSEADEIWAEFWDGNSYRCSMVGKDDFTDLAVLSVNRNIMLGTTLNNVQPASLGTSKSTTLKGTPVIALGAPTGISDSMAYGMITSAVQNLHITDADYKYIGTDIIGTGASSGVIVNLRGNVVGIIDNSFETDMADGVVKAIGITELKRLIEKISNSEAKAYLGIQGTDITADMMKKFSLPEGIYINNVAMDSPAMVAGIQNGDILQGIVGEEIRDYEGLIAWLSNAEPESEATVMLMRQSVDTYVPMELTVSLGTMEYSTTE